MDKNIEERVLEIERKVNAQELGFSMRPRILSKNYSMEEITQMKNEIGLMFQRYNFSIDEAKELLYMVLNVIDNVGGKIRVWSSKHQ